MSVRGKKIISTKPRLKRMYTCVYLFFFIFVVVYAIMCSPWPYTYYIFHTLMAQKVTLNTNQTSNINLGQWAYNNSDKLCTSSIDAA